MAEIEVPIESRLFSFTLSTALPVPLQQRIDANRYAQTIAGINSIFGAPQYRYASVAIMIGTILFVGLAITFNVTELVTGSFYSIMVFSWFLFIVIFAISVNMRIRSQILTYLAGENLYYSQSQISFSYRRPMCLESPVVVHDFGGAMASYQGGVGAYQSNMYQPGYAVTTSSYQQPGYPVSTLQPVQIYYTTVPPPGAVQYTPQPVFGGGQHTGSQV